MPAIINSDNGVVSGSSGLKTSGANDGILALQNNGTTNVTVTAAGDVGIGTSSPAVKLEVYDASSAVARVTAGTEIFEIRNTGSEARLAVVSADPMTFRTSNVEAMRIDSSGNVGIGTSSVPTVGSTTVLAVGNANGGTQAIVQSGTIVYRTSASTSGVDCFNPNASPISWYTSGTERARIDSSGRLLVGTTSAPSQTGGVVVANNELFVYNIPTTASSANCHISSGESNRFYRSTSALKYKQDIRDIELIDINKFRPVRYKSKCDNDDQTKDHFGVVADEVHAAGITELVSYGADGEIEGFQYERLTVVLLKAIQELKAELDATKAEVAALKARTT